MFPLEKKQNSAIRLPKGCDIENHVLGLCGETYSHNMSMMCSIPTENGARWVYSILECVNCGMPSQPPGMKVTYTSTYFSAVATYVCAAGYVRDSGAGNFSCLGTGNWDNATLICKVDCGPPDDVVGARLSYNQTVLGSIAYHQCLVTNETTNVTCGSSGMWDSPAWLVECLVDCGSPPTQNHMNVTYNSTLSGSTAVYVCVDGYVTASGSENVHCQDSGSWTSITLNCVEMSVTPSSSSSSTTATTLSLPTSFTSPSSWSSSEQSSNTAVAPSPTSSQSLLTSYYSSTVSSSSYSPSSTLPFSSTSVVLAATSSSLPYLLSSSSASFAPSSTSYTAPLSSQLTTSATSTPLYPSSSIWSSGIVSPSSTSRVVTSTCLPLCFCGANNLNSVQLEEITRRIRVELLLDKNTLSKEKRKLISAPDKRPSSQAIGHSAWIMLVIVLGLLLLTDMISMVKGVVRVVRRVKRGKFASRS